MKKIISLVLALTLLVGMLGVSAVALAEDATPTVTANQDKIDAFIAADNGTVDKRGLSVLSKALLELGKITVSENLDKTEADNLFTGMTRTFGTDGKLESSADKIYLQYFKPGKFPGDFANANHAEAGKEVDVNSVGVWAFRLVVVRPTKIEEADEPAEGETKKDKYEYKLEESSIVAKSALITVNTQDVDSPVVTVNSTKFDELVSKGITAGTRYSITTSTSLFTFSDDGKNSDNSYSYITVNYVIEKKIDGNWTKIYDTTADTKVVDGYSDIVSGSGILATNDDVSANKDDVKYRVIYTFVDKYGHEGVDREGQKSVVTLNLYVNAKKTDAETTKKVDAWKIVLYVIAGLSAVGIVVLLCIKPKQPEGANVINGRVHYGDNDNTEGSETTADNETENK